ncbi:MAG: DNA-directed RNA polymerase subunit alpha C-terminal domain-containing protein [Planctomycetota bacterium]
MNSENSIEETIEETIDVDYWGWHSKKPNELDLSELLDLRKVVLSNKYVRRALDSKVEELGEVAAGKSDASQLQGVASWLCADYQTAYDYLEKSHGDDVTAFAFAEAALFAGGTGTENRPSRPGKAAEALVSSGSQHPEAITLRLKALRASGQLEQAEAAFKKAGEAYAETPDGLFFQGLLYEGEDDYDKAEECYEKGIKTNPLHVDCLFRKAYRRDMSSEDSEAISLYERIANQQPTHVNALINLGVLFEDADRYHDAVYCYRRVLAAFPRHPRALLFLKDAESSLNMHYDEDQEVRQDKKNQILKIPVSDFELSVRSRNCLSKMNIITLADLVMRTEPELLSYKNFGETSLNEIKQILDSKGLRLGMRPEDELEPVAPRAAAGPGGAATTAPVAAPASFSVDPNDSRLQMLCGDMNLSVRSRKCLANLNIKTVGALIAYTSDELLAQRNFGATSLREITDQVETMGLAMRTVDR